MIYVNEKYWSADFFFAMSVFHKIIGQNFYLLILKKKMEMKKKKVKYC